jgi:hypothetical protein
MAGWDINGTSPSAAVAAYELGARIGIQRPYARPHTGSARLSPREGTSPRREPIPCEAVALRFDRGRLTRGRAGVFDGRDVPTRR